MKTSQHATFRFAATLTGLLTLAPLTNATNYLWSVVSPGVNNWNVNGNWIPASFPIFSSDVAVFGNTGTVSNATTVNNNVSVSTSLSSLQYTNTTNGQWHVTQVPGGVLLSVVGNAFVGGGLGDSLVTSAAMTGAGTFRIVGGSCFIGNQGVSSLNSGSVFDLSGLTNFVFAGSAGNINIGVSNRSSASLTLAFSNNILAGAINLNTGSISNSGTGGLLKFGAGTNIVAVNAINIGAARTDGTATFAASTGGLRIRGLAGTEASRVMTIAVGNRNAGSPTGETTTGTLDFMGHPVDLKASILSLGQETASASYGQSGVGSLWFDQGVLDVTTINMAVCSGSGTNNAAVGILNAGSNATVRANNIFLCNLTSVSLGAWAAGTLTVSGGAVICSNLLTEATSLPGSTGMVEVVNGTLFVRGRLGSSAIPVDMLCVSNATLKFIVDATSPQSTNAVVKTLDTDSGLTTIAIDQAIGVTGPTTFPLIAYSTFLGSVASNFTVSFPPGYTGGLVDNATGNRIDLTIMPGASLDPGQGADLSQLSFPGGTNSNIGKIKVNRPAVNAASGLTSGFINLADGTNWLVRNLPVFDAAVADATNMTTFFSIPNITNGAPITNARAAIQYTPLPVTNMNFFAGPVREHVVSNEFQLIGGVGTNDVHGYRLGTDFTNVAFVSYTHTHTYQNNHKNVQAAANQCAPAAVANSLQWLKDNKGLALFDPNIPGLRDDINPGDVSLVGKLEKAMNRNVTSRLEGRGVWPLDGKLKFLADAGLADMLTVKHVSSLDAKDGTGNVLDGSSDYTAHGATSYGSGSVVTWEWIKEELEHGEDVELDMIFIGTNGQPKGRHYVEVTGAGMIGGVPYITHISDQMQTGQEDLTDSKGTDSVQFDYMLGNILANSRAIADQAISESMRPRLTITILPPQSVLLGGFNGIPNGTNYILSSTNLALPLTNWGIEMINTFDSSGNFLYTNAVGSNIPQKFFRLQMPR